MADWGSPVDKEHVGILGSALIQPAPDRVVIAEVGCAGLGDSGAPDGSKAIMRT